MSDEATPEDTPGRAPPAAADDAPFQILVEESPDVVVVHDGAQIVYINRRGHELFADGCTLVGRLVTDFIRGADRERVAARVRAMLERGEPSPPTELAFTLPSGEVIEGELLSAPLDHGGRRLIHTVIRDITRRKRAETALLDTQERYRSLFDGVPVGLYRSTADGRLLDVNRALVEMLGFPDREALLATRVPELYVDPGEREAWIADAIGAGTVSGREVRLHRLDGEEIQVRLSTTLIRDAAGRLRFFEGALEDVTASRRAEERYRLLFETMAQGVVYHDAGGRITSVNPAAERLLGRRADELVGRTPAEVDWHTVRSDGAAWPGEEHPALEALREGRTVDACLMGVSHPDRSDYLWIQLEATPLFRPGEARPYQVYSAFVDVTERRAAERQVRESEQRLDRALAGSGLGLWDWDLSTDAIYVDDRWYRMLGLDVPVGDRPAMCYDDWAAMVHPDDLLRVEVEIGRHLAGETPFYEAEFRIRGGDGAYRWVLDRGQVVEWRDDGRPARAAGTHRDIGDAKEAQEALRRSEERLATIIRAAPLGITLSRLADGVFLEVNDTFAREFGYERSELVGRSSLELGMWDRADRDAVVREFEETGRLRGATAHFRRRDGTALEIQLFAELITVEGVVCALTLHRDVTESRRLEEQLRQAQKMEAVGRLAGGIAHDFNNLLTAISGHVRFLLDALPEDDDRRADAEGIEASAARAERLTRQLLAFSRQQMLRPRVVNLADVIGSFEPLLRRLIGEDVVLGVEASAEPCWVRVDPGQLEQVVLNLAVNARDAMPDGGSIAIASRPATLTGGAAPGFPQPIPAGRYACLEVADTGSGMDAATRARVFEPFFTTKPPGKGTGLGLSTVYGIINQSDGHIGVRSDAGTGTTFTIYLPMVEERPRTHVPAAVEETDGPSGGTESVLLVEDEDAVRALAVRILTRAGYSVHAAVDGQAALEVNRTAGPFDLLLTDMVMPGLSGRELADRMRADHPGLRVVYMSGYTSDEFVRDVEHPNGNFLEKPFTPRQLADLVRRSLDG